MTFTTGDKVRVIIKCNWWQGTRNATVVGAAEDFPNHDVLIQFDGDSDEYAYANEELELISPADPWPHLCKCDPTNPDDQPPF